MAAKKPRTKKCNLYVVQRKDSQGYVDDDFATYIISSTSRDKAIDMAWKTWNTQVVKREEFIAKPLKASRNKVEYQFSAPKRIKNSI